MARLVCIYARAVASRGGRALAGLVVLLACLLVGAPARADRPEGVTAQTLKLPSGAASLKGLGESFSPNLSTGTGSFSVPLQAPPGFLAPELALQYTAGKGKGLAGQSFDLPVLEIYRSRDKGSPAFDERDRFAVRGPGYNDELVLVDPAAGLYRLKNEGAFGLFVRNAVENSWTLRFPSGQTAFLGASPETRQTSRGRTFAWFIERQEDRFGHGVAYRYFEDGGRLYLSEIEYQLHAPDGAYRNRVTLEYEERPDVFTDYGYGAAVTTRLRLGAVTMRHGSRVLRTYRLRYTQSLQASFLESVAMTGERGLALPTLTFQYLEDRALPGQLVTMSDSPPLESLLDGTGHLEDVTADGLPDLLVTRAGQYHYYENVDGRRWGPRRLLTGSPDRSTADPGVVLADVDGDGARDLVHPVQGGFRYYPGGKLRDGVFLGYGAARTLKSSAGGFDFSAPAVKMTDLDGDGRTDLIWQKPGRDGRIMNGSDGLLREEAIPELPLDADFGDPRVELMDFNGDGELDLVLPELGYSRSTLRVWFGLGRGEYRAAEYLSGVPTGDPSEFHLRDVNHDGQADLVRVSGAWATWYLNRGDLRFSGARSSYYGIPSASTTERLLFADMNGNGSEDLVFVTTDFKLRTFDLMGEANPGLLSQIDNGLGLVTDIAYRMSTDYAVEAKLQGEPWRYPMPLAVPLLSELRTTDSWDRLGFAASETVTTYDYRDGYYDGKEREFRGFERVVTTEWGDERHETLVTETRMHIGRDPETGADQEILKGKPYLVLTRDADGALLGAVESEWEARWLCQEDLTTSDLLLPRCGGQSDAVLSAKKDANVALAVSSRALTATWERTRNPRYTASETTFNDWGQPIVQSNWGEITLPRPYEPGDGVDLQGATLTTGDDEARTETDILNDTSQWLIGLPIEQRLLDGSGQTARRVATYYDGPDFEGLPRGQTTLGLVTRVAELFPDESRWVDRQRTAFDGHGQPRAQQDALGNLVELDRDAETGFFAVAERVLADSGWLRFTAEWDRGQGTITRALDPNGHERRFKYDGLGRLTEAFEPGETRPVAKFSYDFGSAARPVSTTRAETLQTAAGGYGLTITYSDGAGRARQTKQRAEASHGYIASGWSDLSLRGKPVTVTEPWSSQSPELEAPGQGVPATETDLDPLGRAVILRPPATTELGATTVLTQYLPQETRAYTERESTLGDLAHPVITRMDGLGRPVSVEKYNTTPSGLERLRFQVTYDVRGQITSFADPAWDRDRTTRTAENDQRHRRRYTYDGLGRLTAIADRNLGAVEFGYDDLDRMTTRRNALGETETWLYGRAGRLTEHRVAATATAAAYSHRLHYDAVSPDSPLPAASLPNLIGQLAWVEFPTGEEHYAYDSRGRLSQEAHRLWDPSRSPLDGQVRDTFRRSITYRPDGLPEELRSVGGFTQKSEYDARGALETLSVSVAGSPTERVVEALRYDARGLDVLTDAGNGTRVCKAYDERGQLIGMAAGKQTALTCANGARLGDKGDVGRDPGGQGLGFHHLQYSRSYDGLITRIEDLSERIGGGGLESTAAGPPRLDAEYTYDAIHQLTSAKDAEGVTMSFHYDTIQNLIRQSVTDASGKPSGALSVPVGDFEYGEGGAGPGAITSAGCKALQGLSSDCQRYRYDAAGRLLGYRGYTLTWNAEGLLVEATKTLTGRRVRYYYDAWGERRLTVVEDRGKKPKVTRYVFGEYQERDGEKVWLTGAGSVGVEVVASQGVEVDLTLLDELVGFSEGTRISPRPLPAEYEDLARDGDGFGQTDLALARDAYAKGERVGGERLVWRYVTTDHLGSATHVTDSRGELVSSQRFLAYGKARDRRGAAPLRGYIGKDVEADQDLGLVRMGARWYAPELGRFVTADPLIGQSPGLMAGRVLESGLYGYAANNPVMGKDPTGLATPGRSECEGLGNRRASSTADSADAAPKAAAIPPTLTEEDWSAAAVALGVVVPTVKAVAEVEGGKGAFLSDGRPTILYERHVFKELTDGKHDASDPEISGPKYHSSSEKDAKGNAYAETDVYGGSAKQHDRLADAMALDKEAALKSASWGRFQIMGRYYAQAGYADVESFVDDMKKSERKQLDAFVALVKSRGLDKALKNKDWAAFAKGYNGAGYAVNKYDTKLKDAYDKFANPPKAKK